MPSEITNNFPRK